MSVNTGVGRGCPGQPKKQRNSDGRYILSNGYVRVRQDDVVGKDKWILEHRLVMEQTLGRKLLPGEQVHHKDGNRLNNAPDNLELWVTFQPIGQRPEDLVAYAKEILSRYAEAD